MTVDPISSYASQNLGADVNRDSGFLRQTLSARVSTRSVGLELGKLALRFRSEDVSFVPQPVPATRPDFSHELELNRLAQHVTPFCPAGAVARNATLQRLGATAYSQQALCGRTVTPMISILV